MKTRFFITEEDFFRICNIPSGQKEHKTLFNVPGQSSEKLIELEFTQHYSTELFDLKPHLCGTTNVDRSAGYATIVYHHSIRWDDEFVSAIELTYKCKVLKVPSLQLGVFTTLQPVDFLDEDLALNLGKNLLYKVGLFRHNFRMMFDVVSNSFEE